MNITAELLSEWMNEAADEATEELRAEITQLRAELAAERELADRMAKQLDAWVAFARKYDDFIDAVEEEDERALQTWCTRRNK